MSEGKGRIGTSLDGFLEQEQRREEVTAAANKQPPTRQIVEAREAGRAEERGVRMEPV